MEFYNDFFFNTSPPLTWTPGFVPSARLSIYHHHSTKIKIKTHYHGGRENESSFVCLFVCFFFFEIEEKRRQLIWKCGERGAFGSVERGVLGKESWEYLFIYTINNKIPYLDFDSLCTKIPLHKFLNSLKCTYLLVK